MMDNEEEEEEEEEEVIVDYLQTYLFMLLLQSEGYVAMRVG